MDTDYFFLCPKCGKLTIATGSGDPTDKVDCHECGGAFKAFYIAGVGNGINVNVKISNKSIDRVYATEKSWYDILHKE